jgi:hypothetical protein
MYQSLISIALLVSFSAVSFNTVAGNEIELAYGKGVQVRDNVITLDKGFISRLVKRPSLESSDQHIWEIIYFIHITDQQAMKLGLELIALDYPEGAKIDDHHRTREIARALSVHEEIFWDLLKTMPLQIRKKVIHFYDINRTDYVGHDYDEEKTGVLKIK